jgi:hypothetical protein
MRIYAVAEPLWAIAVPQAMALFGHSHEFSTLFVD